MTRPRLLLALLLFATLDQASKWLALLLLADGPFPLWPGVFQLTLAHNTGAAFSLFSHNPQVLGWVTAAIFTGIATFAFSRPRLSGPAFWSLALILGGALGNLIDRFRLGQVTDFLDLIAIHYPVFNLADSFIFIGVFLLVRATLRGDDLLGPTSANAPSSAGDTP